MNIYESTVRLMHQARDDIEVGEIINALKIKYGDEFCVYVNRSRGHEFVMIPMYVYERFNGIKEQAIGVLCRKLERTKDEKKRQIIATSQKTNRTHRGSGRGMRSRSDSMSITALRVWLRT